MAYKQKVLNSNFINLNCKQQLTILLQEMILAFTREAEHRVEAKLHLRGRNQTPQRPDDSMITKQDSSLKKNTAFVRKLVGESILYYSSWFECCIYYGLVQFRKG